MTAKKTDLFSAVLAVQHAIAMGKTSELRDHGSMSLGDCGSGWIGIALHQFNGLVLNVKLFAMEQRHQPELASHPFGLLVEPAVGNGLQAESYSFAVAGKCLSTAAPDMAAELIQQQHQR